MLKHLILFFALTILAVSCAPTAVSPSLPPTAAVTVTITPSPEPSVTPTITPYPPLQTQGPYLLFTNDDSNFIILDADGTGRKQFQLPDHGYILAWWIFSLQNAVSPDGKWLAYFTGSMREKPYDLALNLFDLENQTTFKVASVMAPGYPENLEPVKTSDPVELESCDEGPCRIRLIQSAFEAGIQSLSWSPDSRELAFSAQIDGPSSDIYIFKLEDQSIRRLVSDLENVARIQWAPSGKRILYENSTMGLTYATTYFYVANPSIAAVQSPRWIESCKFCSGTGWIDERSYLMWSGGEGAPPSTFRTIDTETQQMKVIWEPESESFAVNSELHALIVTSPLESVNANRPQVEAGTYFVPLAGKPTKIFDEMYEPVDEPGFPNSFFIQRDGQLCTVDIDGFTQQLVKANAGSTPVPHLSPNKKWLIVEDSQGLHLYSDNLELIQAWEISASELIWRPDSEGLFLLAETGMHYLPIPEGEPVLISECARNSCPTDNYVWLP